MRNLLINKWEIIIEEINCVSPCEFKGAVNKLLVSMGNVSRAMNSNQ